MNQFPGSKFKLVVDTILDGEIISKAILDACPVPCALNDEHQNIIHLNPAFVETLGYTLEDIPTLADWWPRAYPDPGYRRWVTNTWGSHLEEAKVKGDKFTPLELNIQCKDGGFRTMMVGAASLVGKYQGTHLVVLYDISAQKLAAELSRQNEERFHNVIESFPSGVLLVNNEGEIIFVNRRLLEQFGYSIEELTGQAIEVLLPNCVRQAHVRHRGGYIQNPQTRQMGRGRDLFGLRKDGTEFPVEVGIQAMETAEGRITLATVVDITERKATESKYLKSEERFRTLIEATAQIVWTANAQGKVIEDVPSLRAFTGQSFKEIQEEGWSQHIHPEDIRRVLDAWSKAVETKSLFEIEYRLRRHDGIYRDFEVRGVPIVQPDGKIREWVGTCIDITNRKQDEELIWMHANYDILTNLPNRRLLYDRLGREIKIARRAGTPLALLMIDLDKFKDVNDTQGHDEGDLLLVEAANRIGKCVRETDTVARLGGDEFMVILSNVGQGRLKKVVQDILHALSMPFALSRGQADYISASIGITLFPDDALDIASLMKNADQAMYAAKSAGRNRYSFFARSMQQDAQEKHYLSNELRHALVNNELEVYYQPIVDRLGRIVKAEALLRWNHPDRGMISPIIFIPLAEESGLIHEIGEWVFQETLSIIEKWRNCLGHNIQISVNKSPVQFEGKRNQHWIDELIRSGLPGGCITVEITEGLLIKDSAQVRESLHEYRSNGIEVSIDDFGTGFSALSYLKQFDIDYIKIDRSFVSNICENQSDKALSEAIIVMAHKLGIKTIAEGVETKEQRDMLFGFGCDYFQGYYFSRPVPIAEFEKLLEE